MCMDCVRLHMRGFTHVEPDEPVQLFCARCGDDTEFPVQVDDCGNLYCDPCRVLVDDTGAELPGSPLPGAA